MEIKRIVLISLALILIMPLLISCSEEQANKMGDDYVTGKINSIFGKTTTPTSTEVERYDLKLTFNLSVKAFYDNNIKTVPAYPQKVNFRIDRMDTNKGTAFDVQEIEKWTDKTGNITLNIFFERVYINEDISISYITPPLVTWDGEKKEGASISAKIIKSKLDLDVHPQRPLYSDLMTDSEGVQIMYSYYDVGKKCLNLTLDDLGYMPYWYATSPIPTKYP